MAAASLLQGRAQSSGRKMVFRWAKEQGAGRDRPIDYRDLTGAFSLYLSISYMILL